MDEAEELRVKEFALTLAKKQRYRPLLVGTVVSSYKGRVSLEQAEALLNELVKEGRLTKVGGQGSGCALGYKLV